MSVIYRTTCPNDDKYWTLQRVDCLTYESDNNLDLFGGSHICFSRIQHLCIDLPVSEKFWIVVENLQYLKSL